MDVRVSVCFSSDCLWLVDRCGDKRRMKLDGLSPEDICTLVTPFNETCISLRDFIPGSSDDTNTLGDSTLTASGDHRVDMTYPCQPNPCHEGFVCEPNRECPLSRAGCTPFRCIRGIEPYQSLMFTSLHVCLFVCRSPSTSHLSMIYLPSPAVEPIFSSSHQSNNPFIHPSVLPSNYKLTR